MFYHGELGSKRAMNPMVFLNGRSLGQTAPLQGLPLPLIILKQIQDIISFRP